MKLTPIKYQEGWLYVDKKAPVKLDGYPYIVLERLTTGEYELWQVDNANDTDPKTQWLIVAQSPNLFLPNIPYIEEVEESIESLAHKVMMNYLTNDNPNGDFKHSTIGADDNKNWWIAGYKAAQSKGGGYSEADLRKAYEAGIHFNEESNESFGATESKWKWDTFIESINQPKEIEIEMEKIFYPKNSEPTTVEVGHGCLFNYKPVTYQKDGKKLLKLKHTIS